MRRAEMKIITLLLILSIISCSRTYKTSQGSFIFNDTLDFSTDYINNIDKYILSSDTVLTYTSIVYEGSVSTSLSGIYYGCSDENNNIISLFHDLFIEYNSDGTISNEYFVNPNKTINKVHYYYRNGNLIKVDYIKINSIDTLVNVRKLYYDENNNLYFERINNPISNIQIEKIYKNSKLVSASISSYDHLVELTEETQINYFYEDKLLTKLSVLDKLRNNTSVRDYFYNSNGRLVSSRDTTFGEDISEPMGHLKYNSKNYIYDGRGRLSKIIKKWSSSTLVKEIQYPDNYHNEKIKPRFFDNIGYYANLRFSWY